MKKISLLIISFSFYRGGAGIAANRLSNLIDSDPNIYLEKVSADKSGVLHFIKRLISYGLLIFQRDNILCKKSINLFSLSKLKKLIAAYKNKKIFHFHWMNNDTLSIFYFKKIPPYSIITLHDEWLYCGIEHCHYFNDKEEFFSLGYRKKFHYIDIGYYVWKIKASSLRYREDIIYTVPSSWMLNRAKKSIILKGKDIRLLYNPIDTFVFSPSDAIEINKIKKRINIPIDNTVIMFGAVDGEKSILKGAKSLIQALHLLQKKIQSHQLNKITLLTFGGKFTASNLKFPIINLGYIKKQDELAKIYSLADVMVVPSLVESFGQVAAEAQSCGIPVIGYDNTGLTDIIKNNKTGFIVPNNNSEALCNAILKIINFDEAALSCMKKNSRRNIEINFSLEMIRRNYTNIIIEQAKKKKLIEN
ncbi:TPA: glycosyltransferase [Providencia alcalifaciens]